MYAATNDNLIIGGYNPKGWIGVGDGNRFSTEAFLFINDKNDNKDTNKNSKNNNFIKLTKVGGSSMAIINDNIQSGIFFGPDALVIPLVVKPYGYPTLVTNKMARSRLGSYYEKLPGDIKSLFAYNSSGSGGGGDGVVDRKGLLDGTLSDVIVLGGVFEKNEIIPFTTVI